MGVFYIVAGCFGILSTLVPRANERQLGWPVKILVIFFGLIFIYIGLQRLGVIRFGM
jgi:hypothetical protein